MKGSNNSTSIVLLWQHIDARKTYTKRNTTIMNNATTLNKNNVENNEKEMKIKEVGDSMRAMRC